MIDRSTHHVPSQLAAGPAQGQRRETWLTVAEVAQRIRVSRDTVERWIHAHLLVAVDIGTARPNRCHRPCWRICSDSLENFLAARATQPPAAPPLRSPRQTRKQPGIIEFIK